MLTPAINDDWLTGETDKRIQFLIYFLSHRSAFKSGRYLKLPFERWQVLCNEVIAVFLVFLGTAPLNHAEALLLQLMNIVQILPSTAVDQYLMRRLLSPAENRIIMSELSASVAVSHVIRHSIVS